MSMNELPLAALAAIFAISTIMVWMAGTRLAIYGDELSERFNLSREFIGLIFLAAVTELPEIVTTVTAAQSGNAPLVLGNLFGGITTNTAILAVIDFFVVRNALTSWPRKPNHALLAVLLIVLLAGLLAITFLGDIAVVLFSLLVLAVLALTLREPAAAAYCDFLAWIYSEQRSFHKLMTASLSTFADQTGWSAGASVVMGSFLYGIFHAAGPGHGKVILSTYLLTQPERVGKSVAMSIASAFMQGVVAVVLVYGLFYVFGLAARDAKVAVLWSERISFGIIMGLGVVLVWRSVRGLKWFGDAKILHNHGVQPGHGHRHHDQDGVCQTCGHSHLPTDEQLDAATDWRAVISVIISIGLRPCSGAILVLVFAKFSGIPLAGVLAVAAISAGTAITVSTLAVLSVKARGFAVSLLGATSGRIDTVGHVVALAGGAVLILLGYGLLASSWSAPMRSMGL